MRKKIEDEMKMKNELRNEALRYIEKFNAYLKIYFNCSNRNYIRDLNKKKRVSEEQNYINEKKYNKVGRFY